MKVLYLPLDERPCNSQFALRIAQGSPVQMVTPPMSMLGNKKTPTDTTKLAEFLVQNVADAQYVILSMDMLLYGGIVPSRLHQLDTQVLCQKLEVVKALKQKNPHVKIFAFALITRCPCYSSDDEEPFYYENCGREIFLTGQVKHKMQLGLIDKSEGEKLLAEYGKKTQGHLEDFEKRRNTNRQMLVNVANMLGKEIDFLVIPQDDSAPYGYTTMDREYLLDVFAQNNLDIAMYPGADEVGMTLLARAVCDSYGVQPKIYCQYPNEECQNVIPLYEDRPIKKTLPFQIGSAGCAQADRQNADIYLYLNYPTESPVSEGEGATVGYQNRDMEGFCNDVRQGAEQGKVVAIADSAYCNCGELELLERLQKQMDLFDLSAYAGWNTSSNTLGTAICQAVFVHLFGKNEQQNKFLAERIYEDVGYCGYVRRYVTQNILPQLSLNYFDAGQVDGEVAKIVKQCLQDYINRVLPTVSSKYLLDLCQMPWKRMFEVNLTVKKNEN